MEVEEKDSDHTEPASLSSWKRALGIRRSLLEESCEPWRCLKGPSDPFKSYTSYLERCFLVLLSHGCQDLCGPSHRFSPPWGSCQAFQGFPVSEKDFVREHFMRARWKDGPKRNRAQESSEKIFRITESRCGKLTNASSHLCKRIMIETHRNPLEKPAFLPDSYGLGDPLPTSDLEDHPEWADFSDFFFTPETKAHFLKFIRSVGPNATNQMARCTEYYAQATDAKRSILNIFGDQGKRSETAQWLLCVHPEIELCYDRDPKSSTFCLMFYMSFVGRNIPKKEEWADALKLQLLNVHLEEMTETVVYVPYDDPKNNHHPSTALAIDPDVMFRYGKRRREDGVRSTSDPGAGRSSRQEPWCEHADGMVLYDDLEGTTFDESYLGSFEEQPNEPFKMSHPSNLKVGNPEMIRREQREPLKSIAERQAPPKNKRKGEKSNFSGFGNVRQSPSKLGEIWPPGPLARPDAETFSRINEIDPGRAAELPTVSRSGCLSSPEGKRLYVNGLKLRRKFESELSLIFPTKNLTRTGKPVPVGFNTLSKHLISYRVIVRTTGTPYHSIDWALDPPCYEGKDEFENFFAKFKTSWEAYLKETGSKPTGISQLLEQPLTPLITEEDRAYAELVGIKIPDWSGPVTTAELVKMVEKKRKELGSSQVSPMKKKLRSKIDEELGKNSSTTTLDDFFKKK